MLSQSSQVSCCFFFIRLDNNLLLYNLHVLNTTMYCKKISDFEIVTLIKLSCGSLTVLKHHNVMVLKCILHRVTSYILQCYNNHIIYVNYIQWLYTNESNFLSYYHTCIMIKMNI